MRRHVGLWLMTGMTLVLLLTGCQKKQPYINIVEQTPYLGFPQEPEHIVQIDVAGLRGREDYQTLREQWEATPQLGPFLKGLREQAGFDALEQTDLLCVAQKGPNDPLNPWRNKLIIARGKFKDMPGVLEKLPAFLGSDYLIAPPAFKQNEVAGIRTYQTAGQSQYDEKLVFDINIGLPSAQLMTIAFSPQNSAALLEVIGGAQPGLQQDKAWLDKLRLVNTGANVWGVGDLEANKIPIGLLGGLGQQLKVAKRYYFYGTGNADVKVEAGLVCGSIDEATKLTDDLKAYLNQMKAIFQFMAKDAPTLATLPGKIIVLTDLQTSKISFNLTAAEVRTLQVESSKMSQMKPAAAPGGANP